ncbi:hypothetical protein FHN55_13470 [Streptomyces sp. NP160]|uniref:hypothetical protein n=1 Tax=Streptomyces sp. NP160 TaxID=2586637 RepID=UPI001119FDAB|nr:hypothetical protein [Streptomyces sp. NP160]TNM64530.1 hypothetical protein FHN55_13470 [Streptomyces sp. NP160]
MISGDGGGDDDLSPDLWSPESLEQYRARAQELSRVLAEHAALVEQRAGRQRELEDYVVSAERLQGAVNAFAEAEFAWCGSFPVRTSEADEDGDEDGDGGVWPLPDPSLAEAPVISVLGRWDYVVTDADELVAHGRDSYRAAWPEDDDEDAALRVQTVLDAVRETLHEAPLPRLDDAPGLQPSASVVQLVQHAGTSEEELTEDPFGLVSHVGADGQHDHGPGACGCGRELDPGDRHSRFSWPDALFALVERGEEVPGLWMSGEDVDSSDMVASPDLGAFVRVLLPVELDDGGSLTYGTWLQVHPHDQAHAHTVWSLPEYQHLVLEGKLANDVPPGGVLGAHARAVVTDPDQLPRVVDSTDGVLNRVLLETWGAHLHAGALGLAD